MSEGDFCKKKSPFFVTNRLFDKAEMEIRTIKEPLGVNGSRMIFREKGKDEENGLSDH